MKRPRPSALLKFVAFMATLGGSLEDDGNRDGANNDNSRGLSAQKSSCSLVLVSTLDGKLSALDTQDNGKLLWSLPAFSGPLFSSSLSSAQMAKHMHLVPSLDGALYQVIGDKVEPIPFSADTLLGSFYTLPDQSILLGGKEAISCGIDPYSGKVHYICSADGCQLSDSEGHVQNNDVLVLKRIQQTIRAVDQRSGVERWNFSVGQQDLSFLGASFKEDNVHCPVPGEDVFTEWTLRVSIPNGLVAAVHSHGLTKGSTSEVTLWSHKFESPVAGVWRLSGDFIQQVQLLSKEVMPELAESPTPEGFPQRPVMYIGKHEGQVYIQTSEPFNPGIDSAQRVGDITGNAVAQRPKQITWRPYLTSSPSRTPTVVTKDLAVWNPVEYPFDNGYYLYGDVMPVIPPHNKNGQLVSLADSNGDAIFEKNRHNSSNSDVDTNKESMWWHGAVFVTVLVAVVIQFLLKFLGGPNRPKLEAIEYHRHPSATFSTGTSSTASTATIKGLPTPTSSDSLYSLTPSNSFVSRYLTDFEHELCLGKGGFGLVFQARNKLDDCRYAIKRIRLPNCDEAREKVMREVKALAKLEHPGIVRYFQSWFEAPPVGWQEELDIQMYQQGTYCGLPSESISLGSGIVMNVKSADDELYNQQAPPIGDSLEKNNFIRRRKKTNSSSRSRHSSHNTNSDNDTSSGIINGEAFSVQQLENEAFLVGSENSESFSIEFGSSSKNTSMSPKNGLLLSGVEDSGSHSIVFQHSEGVSISNDGSVSLSSNTGSGTSDSKQSGSSKDLHFTSSHQSLLSRDRHKCQNKQCNADKLSAPLYLYIQMQLCQQESLKDWLRATHKRNHVYCLTVFEQILCAVEYFHDRGLMHRDLKPSNIFFSLEGSVKVGDFGLVTAHSSENNLETPIKGQNTLIDDINHTGQVGTQLYMSPEQIDGKAYSHKVDIFSLGLLFFELFCPFSTQMERIKVMCDVKRCLFPEDFESKMPMQAELVRWLLSTTPKARPTATEVKNSVLLRQIHLNSHSSSHSEM